MKWNSSEEDSFEEMFPKLLEEMRKRNYEEKK